MNWRIRSRQSCPDVCDSILPLLSLQADGMASADESRRVETHLTTCEDCRRAQSWMQATHLVMTQRPLVTPPTDLRLKIAQAVAAQAAPVVFTTRRPLVLRPGFALAASVAVAAAWFGHSLLTMHSAGTGAPPKQVANAPAPSVNSAPPVPVPTRPAAKSRPVPIRHAPAKTIDKLAMAPTPDAVRVRRTPLEPIQPAPALRPTVHLGNVPHAARLAKAPAPTTALPVKPHLISQSPRIVHEASLPKAAPKLAVPDVTHSPTADPTPVPTVVAAKPDETVAPSPQPESVPVRIAHRDDALSAVRAHLTSYQADGSRRQISRDRDAHGRSALLSSDENLTPYYGMVYTPTHQDP